MDGTGQEGDEEGRGREIDGEIIREEEPGRVVLSRMLLLRVQVRKALEFRRKLPAFSKKVSLGQRIWDHNKGPPTVAGAARCLSS